MDVAQLVLTSIAVLVPLLLGGWILRLYGEREKNWESRRALLEERLKLKDERLEDKDHHIKQMSELHQGSEKLLERQLQELQRKAGVDPEAPLSETAPAIPEEIQRSMLEILGQMKDIRTVVERLAPAAAPPTLTSEDYVLRGNAYYYAGEYDDALAEFNRALELQPDRASALRGRGITLGQLEHYDEALADFNRALDLRPDHADTLMNRSVAFRYLKRYDDALADASRALELRPDDANTLVNRGVAFYDLERHDDTIADLNRALDLQPDHVDALVNRGVAFLNLKRYDEALADFNRALDLRPDYDITLFNRACAYSGKNMAGEAVADLRRAINGDVKYRARARDDSDFDNIRSDPRFRALVGEETPPAEDADGDNA